jgi:hypothetical protein
MTEPPSVEPRLQWPGPVKQPQQSSEVAERTFQPARTLESGQYALVIAHLDVEVVQTWVWPENLRAFAEMLSHWTEYQFDDADWAGLAHGVDESDSDAEKWFSYPIVGHPALEIAVARNVGAEPINVRVLAVEGVSDDVRARISAAAAIFNSYRIS